MNNEKEIKSGEYPEVAGAIDLAITAMQDYQPWIPVSNVKPESGKHVLLCCEIKPLGKRYVCDGYYAQSKTITTICDDDNNYEYAVNFACEQLVKWTRFDLLLEGACS